MQPLQTEAHHPSRLEGRGGFFSFHLAPIKSKVDQKKPIPQKLLSLTLTFWDITAYTLGHDVKRK